MKKLFVALTTVIAALFAFSACNPDNSTDEPSGGNSIVGTWDVVAGDVIVTEVSSGKEMSLDKWFSVISGGAIDDSSDTTSDEDEEVDGRVEFTADGVAIFYDKKDGNWVEYGRGGYTIEGDILTFDVKSAEMLDLADEDVLVNEFTIKTLNSKD